MKKSICIGTRGSKLALVQTGIVKAALEKHFESLDISVEIIKTQGDVMLDIPLSEKTDKGFFTTEIEKALLEHRIDMAVHSLKDLPVLLPNGICLGAILQREDARDVCITLNGKKVTELTPADVVATSSLRRKAQLLALNPELHIIDIRGNVDTRIRKLKEGYCSALVIAAAGVLRLQLKPEYMEYLSTDVMIPAPGQAAIAVEIREDDTEVRNMLRFLNDECTEKAVNAERLFLQTIEAGCHVPSGCFCQPGENDFTISAFISNTDGSGMVKKSVVSESSALQKNVTELAGYLLEAGGKEMLSDYKNT